MKSTIFKGSLSNFSFAFSTCDIQLYLSGHRAHNWNTPLASPPLTFPPTPLSSPSLTSPPHTHTLVFLVCTHAPHSARAYIPLTPLPPFFVCLWYWLVYLLLTKYFCGSRIFIRRVHVRRYIYDKWGELHERGWRHCRPVYSVIVVLALLWMNLIIS